MSTYEATEVDWCGQRKNTRTPQTRRMSQANDDLLNYGTGYPNTFRNLTNSPRLLFSHQGPLHSINILQLFASPRHRSPPTSSTRTTNGNRDTATTPPCPTTSLPRTPGGLSPPPPASPYHGRTTYMLSRSRTRSTTYSVASARKKTKQPARGQGTAESQGGCGDVWQAHAGLGLGSLEISARRRARRLLKWEESNCRICYVCLLWWLLGGVGIFLLFWSCGFLFLAVLGRRMGRKTKKGTEFWSRIFATRQDKKFMMVYIQEFADGRVD